MANPERRHTGLRVALAAALGFSGTAGAVLAGKAILEGTSRQPVSASENQEGGIMPSLKTFNELVTQTPFPAPPTVTETSTVTSTSTVTNTTEPTASNTPTGTATATRPASTATITATATEVPPTKIPATATIKPTEVPPAKPEPTKIPTPKPSPTPVPAEQPTPVPAPEPAPPPKQEPKPEAPATAFPKEIGSLERDGVMIHNMGSRVGVIDNREDPQNNWAAIVAVAKKYAPGDKFEFFFYDNPDDVPWPKDKTWYDPRQDLSTQIPSLREILRLYVIKTSAGVWQKHFSLPSSNLNTEGGNKLNRYITSNTLHFIYTRDEPNKTWGPDFSAILRQHALDPYNSGKMNFSLKMVR